MTTAEIESVLGSEDLRNLLEVAEQSGAVKHAELAEVLEPLELDEMEREALQRELEQRGIDVVEEAPQPEKAEKAPEPPPQPSPTRRPPTRSSSSCARPAATRS